MLNYVPTQEETSHRLESIHQEAEQCHKEMRTVTIDISTSNNDEPATTSNKQGPIFMAVDLLQAHETPPPPVSDNPDFEKLMDTVQEFHVDLLASYDQHENETEHGWLPDATTYENADPENSDHEINDTTLQTNGNVTPNEHVDSSLKDLTQPMTDNVLPEHDGGSMGPPSHSENVNGNSNITSTENSAEGKG